MVADEFGLPRSARDRLKAFASAMTKLQAELPRHPVSKDMFWDSSQGNSGRPLIKSSPQPKLLGVVSLGAGCAQPNKPGVLPVLQWITE